MRFWSLAAASLAVATALPVQARDLLNLEPSSPWALNYAEEHCELAREFGEGNRSVTLALRSYSPEGTFRILLSGPLAVPASSAERIGVEFADLESWQPTFTAGELYGRNIIMLKPAFTFGPLSETAERQIEASAPVTSYSDPEVEAGIETLQFVDGLEREFVLQTGSMGQPMDALRECARGIADSWGVTFAERQALSRIAMPKASGPVLSLRLVERHFVEGAFISILMIVDEDGRVADCRVRGTKTQDDSEAVCSRFRDRARFEPALDADGNPARDYYLLTIQP